MSGLLSVEEAWARIAAHARPHGPVELPLEEAVGRVLALEARSPIDLPPFDRSAMDGYALRAADTADAPVHLKLTAEIAAGHAPELPVTSGTAQRIFTGGALPPGADAVERQEVVADHGEEVELAAPVPPGRHVRVRGEDVREGDLLLAAGERVGARHLSLLASCGLAALHVHRPARVALLVTGDELVEPPATLRPGQIYESNGRTLRTLATGAGADLVDLGIVPDDRARIAAAVGRGLAGADVLLVSGGVSVGEHDHVKAVLGEAGVEELFWGVRVKPGKPLFCGRRGDTWVFGLPGNPLSGVVSFLLFVGPLLRVMAGDPAPRPATTRARVTAAVGPEDGRTTYLTATLARAADGTLEATPTEQQGSAMTAALARADGFVVVPDGGPRLEAGAWVDVLPLDG